MANQKALTLSARHPDGSVTHGECKAVAGPGTRVESDDKAGVKQTIKGSYPKGADGKARDTQAEAWCQAARDDKEASYTTSQGEPNHAAHQGGGTRSPKVTTVLLGLTALSGVTVDRKLKGETGQGKSAANFELPPPPFRNSMTASQVLGIKTPREQPNSTTRVASRRLWTGPLARRRKVERRHSFCLDREGAHAAAKGGGAAPGSTPLIRMTRTTTRATMSRALGVKRWGMTPTIWPIRPATGARR